MIPTSAISSSPGASTSPRQRTRSTTEEPMRSTGARGTMWRPVAPGRTSSTACSAGTRTIVNSSRPAGRADTRPPTSFPFPTSADVGQNLSFGATIGGGVPQRTISWTWGDGTQTSGPANTTHTYSAAGTYDVAVQVVDANGS